MFLQNFSTYKNNANNQKYLQHNSQKNLMKNRKDLLHVCFQNIKISVQMKRTIRNCRSWVSRKKLL